MCGLLKWPTGGNNYQTAERGQVTAEAASPACSSPPPPVTASNRSLTLSLLCLNQGLMLNFGYDPRSNGIGVSFPLQYGIGFQPV